MLVVRFFDKRLVSQGLSSKAPYNKWQMTTKEPPLPGQGILFILWPNHHIIMNIKLLQRKLKFLYYFSDLQTYFFFK